MLDGVFVWSRFSHRTIIAIGDIIKSLIEKLKSLCFNWI